MASIINKDSKLTELPTFNAGESDFLSLIHSDFHYVDKTNFIEKWWNSGNKVSLIVRPRRFSKTTILSMVYHLFQGIDFNYLFKGTYIQKNMPADLVGALGNVNSVLLTFKDISGKTPKKLFDGLRALLVPVYLDYAEYTKEFSEYYGQAPVKGEDLDSCGELLTRLSNFLQFVHKKTSKKFIVLVDEYDKFLADAAKVSEEAGSSYFEDVLDMYRSFLTTMFKDTVFIERAILTGVMPLAANSVMSAFNNAVKDTFFSSKYENVFGFTEDEVAAIFSGFDWKPGDDSLERLDGYSSGSIVVYNPWSIVNLTEQLRTKSEHASNSWITSGNSDWIEYGKDLEAKDVDVIYSLISGNEYTVRINHELNYLDRRDSLDNFLTHAFYTGYLTFSGSTADTASLIIPNEEVQEAWVSNLHRLVVPKHVRFNWSKVLEQMDESSEFAERLEGELSNLLDDCTSSWDLVDKENSYHMWVLGMLSTLSGTHKVASNREAGDGRYDIAVTPVSGKVMRNYVFELKKSNSLQALDADTDVAVNQVLDNRYYKFFNNKYDMVIVGIAAYKKHVKVKIKVVSYKELTQDMKLFGE